MLNDLQPSLDPLYHFTLNTPIIAGHKFHRVECTIEGLIKLKLRFSLDFGSFFV